MAIPTNSRFRASPPEPDTKCGWMLLLYALALVAALSTRHSRGACPREGGERESTPFRAAIEGGGGWPRQPRMQRYPPGFGMNRARRTREEGVRKPESACSPILREMNRLLMVDFRISTQSAVQN